MGAPVFMATRDFTAVDFVIQGSPMTEFIIQDIFSRDSIRGFRMVVFTRHFIFGDFIKGFLTMGFTRGSITVGFIRDSIQDFTANCLISPLLVRLSVPSSSFCFVLETNSS